MELAVNTFSKGLQTDTHPMVQGTDTLSDALNATFITMNGNEVVLQNDMGNRRVDNAYLPAGYEPVGIKEYGGIIYLALYNPITNRSLIGSFPSPERDISGTDSNNDNINFNLRELFNNYDTVKRTYNGSEHIIKYLKNDTLLISISSSMALHPGDKFTLYLDEISQAYLGDRLFKLMISNWNLYSFRDLKRKYTLSLGILNSQNEFVDITSSLERFNDNGDLIKTEFKSEENKFNTGYFICPKAKPLSSGSTLDRDSIASNVYSYKLVGPLYLKAEVSHVKNFGYSVRLSKIQNELGQTTKVTLEIKGTSTYDFFIRLYERNSSESMGGLSPLDGQTDGNIWIPNRLFTPILEDWYKTEITFTQHDINIDEVSKTITLTSQITFTPNQEDEVPIYLEVLGPSSYDFNSLYYLKNLSKVFTFNISDIGTDKMEVTEWRYYLSNINRDDSSFDCLCYLALRCYTEEGFVYKNLSVKVGNREVYSKLSDIFSGGFPFSFSRDSENLGEILEVTIECGKYTKENPDTPSSTVTFTRFLLTTELFNECYDNPDSKDFIIFLNGYPEEKLSESLKILRDRMLTIVPTVDTSEVISGDPVFSNNKNSMFSTEAYSNKIIYETSKKVTLDPSKIGLNFDSNNYPNNIDISLSNPDIREIHCDTEEINVNNYTCTVYDRCKADSITSTKFMCVFVKSNSQEFYDNYVYGGNAGWFGETYALNENLQRYFHIFGPGGHMKLMHYELDDYDMANMSWDITHDYSNEYPKNSFVGGDYGANFSEAYSKLVDNFKNSGFSFFKLREYPLIEGHTTYHEITKAFSENRGGTSPYNSTDIYEGSSNVYCYEFMINSNNDGLVIVEIERINDSGVGAGHYMFPIYNFNINEKLYYPKKDSSLKYSTPRNVLINFITDGTVTFLLDLNNLLQFFCQNSISEEISCNILMEGVSDDFISAITDDNIFLELVDLENGNIVRNPYSSEYGRDIYKSSIVERSGIVYTIIDKGISITTGAGGKAVARNVYNTAPMTNYRYLSFNRPEGLEFPVGYSCMDFGRIPQRIGLMGEL